MAAGEDRHQDLLEDAVLADDAARDFAPQVHRRGGEGLAAGRRRVHRTGRRRRSVSRKVEPFFTPASRSVSLSLSIVAPWSFIIQSR